MIMRKKNSKKKCWLYILECKSTTGKITFYTGITNNLERRLQEHQNNTGKGARYTRNKETAMVYNKEYPNRSAALRQEYKVKALTQLQKKEIILGKTPKCPVCRKLLISSKARTTIQGSMPVNNGGPKSGNEVYYSCTNNCILNVSSSLLKSYTKRLKGEIK